MNQETIGFLVAGGAVLAILVAMVVVVLIGGAIGAHKKRSDDGL